MKNFGIVELSRKGDVFVIQIKNGNDNRVSSELLRQMHIALDEVERSEGAASLVTIGSGNFFCNGIETGENSPYQDPTSAKQASAALFSLLARLLVYPIPTVAAINGHAFGAGAMLALCHDYRVMNNHRGWIGYPVVDLGLILPVPLFEIVRTKIANPGLVRDLILQSKRLNGEEAVRLQFVDRAVNPENVLNDAVAFAQQLATKGRNRKTFGGLKRNMYAQVYSLLQMKENPIEFVKANL